MSRSYRTDGFVDNKADDSVSCRTLCYSTSHLSGPPLCHEMVVHDGLDLCLWRSNVLFDFDAFTLATQPVLAQTSPEE